MGSIPFALQLYTVRDHMSEDAAGTLKRVKEITEKVYVEEEFDGFMDEIREDLIDEVEIRAVASNQNPEQAVEEFDQSLESLRQHMGKRREFILSQEEIQELSL